MSDKKQIKLIGDKVKNELINSHGYDFESDWWADEILTIIHETIQACETVANEQLEQQAPEVYQNVTSRTLEVCTGCGHISDEPLSLNPKGEQPKACCPDNSYVPLKQYCDNSLYER